MIWVVFKFSSITFFYGVVKLPAPSSHQSLPIRAHHHSHLGASSSSSQSSKSISRSTYSDLSILLFVHIEPLVDAVSPSCMSCTAETGRLRRRHIPDADPVHLCPIPAMVDLENDEDDDDNMDDPSFTSTQSKSLSPPPSQPFPPPFLNRRPTEAVYAFETVRHVVLSHRLPGNTSSSSASSTPANVTPTTTAGLASGRSGHVYLLRNGLT